MLRAREQLGTDDIVRILHDYHSPTFGFASHNFYVSFLAAPTVAGDPKKYFGAISARSRDRIPRGEDADSVGPVWRSVMQTVGIDRDEFAAPESQRCAPRCGAAADRFPAGYLLRLPSTASDWTLAAASRASWQRRARGRQTLVSAAGSPSDSNAVLAAALRHGGTPGCWCEHAASTTCSRQSAPAPAPFRSLNELGRQGHGMPQPGAPGAVPP